MSGQAAVSSRGSPGAFLHRWGTLLAIGVLVGVFGIATPAFLDPSNLVNILRSISIVTVIAVGVTISLAAGGFDLSVGSVASTANALVISLFVWYGWGTALAVPVTLLVALALGGLNAFLIVKVRIPDMLATLATMFVVQGVAMTYTLGGSVTENMPMPDGSTAPGHLGHGFQSLGQVPLIIVVMAVAVALVQGFLSLTRPGRSLHAVGGNLEAARLAGIPVDRYRVVAYLASAVLAAVGGLLLASRIGSSQVGAGGGYLMDAVAAAWIGLSFGGSGRPNAVGTLIGAVLLGVLQNGLVMLSVPYYSMDILKGGVLAAALAVTYFRKKS
jgi:simple sugar transport system permease protein